MLRCSRAISRRYATPLQVTGRRGFVKATLTRLNAEQQQVPTQEAPNSQATEGDAAASAVAAEQEPVLEYDLSVEDPNPTLDVSLEEALKSIRESGIESNPKVQEAHNLLREIVFRDRFAANNASNANADSSKTSSFPFLKKSTADEPYSEQELHLRELYHKKTTGNLGAKVDNVYRPEQDIKSPSSVAKIGINTLMAAGCHMGHSTSLWRPSTQPFIYGEYKGIHIIDLDQTLTALKKAAKVVEGVAERNGIVVFVGTRKGQRDSLVQAARRTGGYYVATKWIQGNITNAVKTSENWNRKEVDMEDKMTNRDLNANELTSLVKPDLIVILNPTENRRCIREAMLTRIPTIGLVDTDSEPSLLTYPIPCNDDSLRATNLITGVLSRAGEAGREKRLERIRSYKAELGITESEAGVKFVQQN